MQKDKHKVIREFGEIFRYSDYKEFHPKDDFNKIYLADKPFEYLKCFVSENQDEDVEVEQGFTLHRKRAKDYIRVKNLVGVIELKDKTTIEVLPKIYRGRKSKESDEVADTRKILLKMLKCLKNSPFRSISNAHLKITKFPILEIFITAFLDELEVLVKKGINKHYVALEENKVCLKGKLLFDEQLRQNLLRPDRFYVKHDEFLTDIPQNRIIKSTLIKLSKQSKSIINQNRIRFNLFIFEEVNESRNVKNDLETCFGLNRLFEHYFNVLEWARIFLEETSFTNFKGSTLNKAILFPMEKIFEDYVAVQLKKQLPEYRIKCQEKLHHLVDKHKNVPKFKLKPDIVLRKDDEVIVIDAKWKILDENDEKHNYGISQADMYQLFAYGKKYSNSEINPRLMLIYPKQERFQGGIEMFDYDEVLGLLVVSIDCENGIINSRSQLKVHILLENG